MALIMHSWWLPQHPHHHQTVPTTIGPTGELRGGGPTCRPVVSKFQHPEIPKCVLCACLRLLFTSCYSTICVLSIIFCSLHFSNYFRRACYHVVQYSSEVS